MATVSTRDFLNFRCKKWVGVEILVRPLGILHQKPSDCSTEEALNYMYDWLVLREPAKRGGVCSMCSGCEKYRHTESQLMPSSLDGAGRNAYPIPFIAPAHYIDADVGGAYPVDSYFLQVFFEQTHQ